MLSRGYDTATSVVDNNMAARQAASVFGCGDILVQRCQETLEEYNDISQPVKLGKQFRFSLFKANIIILMTILHNG